MTTDTKSKKHTFYPMNWTKSKGFSGRTIDIIVNCALLALYIFGYRFTEQ